MRNLVCMGLLLMLTVVCGVAGLVRMIGMPLGVEFLSVIFVLGVAVCGMGLQMLFVPERRLVPIRVQR